jgi:hypothetical protein
VKKLGRLEVFDTLRGIFMLVIIIDHVEFFPSIYDFFSGRGQLWVSAAEGFFFISGLLIGYIYRDKIKQNTSRVFKKIWLRSLKLYLWSIALTLLFTWWAFNYDNFLIKDGLIAAGTSWLDILKQAALLEYSFGWADFLPHYAVFLFFAPFALYLLKNKLLPLVLLIMASLWFVRGQSFTAAWQVFFFGGLLVGYYWVHLRSWYYGLAHKTRKRLNVSILGLTAVTLAISWSTIFVLHVILLGNLDSFSPGVQEFAKYWYYFGEEAWVIADKWTVGPLRMAMFALWFSALYMIVRKNLQTIHNVTFDIVDFVGRYALSTYIIHSIFIFAFHIHFRTNGGFIINFIYTTIMLALIIGATYAVTRVSWLRKLVR